MLAALRTTVSRRTPPLVTISKRYLATETELPNDASPQFLEESRRQGIQLTQAEPESDTEQQARFEEFLKEKEKEGPLRPQRRISVDPEHGLWAFFRKLQKDGTESYETVERDAPGRTIGSGRPWNAFELRRKSFKDLHTLWYILLRERNLLATQRAEAKRLEVNLSMLAAAKKDYMCRKSMARIKQVLNERRIAYEKALVLRREEILKGVEERKVQAAGTAMSTASAQSSRTLGRRRRDSHISVFRANNPTEPRVESAKVEESSEPQTNAGT